MKRIAVSLMLIGTAFLLGACTATLPINYAPSNLAKGTGTVSVERFVYSAARQGKVDPNEVEKNPSGIGNIYLAEDIESLFTDAVRKELRFSGYSLTASDAPTVGGVIDRFYYDWVGLITTDVEVAVTFQVRKDGKEIFSRLISAHKEAPKAPGYETEAIKAAISECIQRFLEEVHRQGVFGPNVPNRIAKSNLSSPSLDIIGKWKDSAWPVPAVITIYREGGVLFMKYEFGKNTASKGSTYKKEMISEAIMGQTRFREKDENSHGDYYVVDGQGNLGIYDGEGFIRTALSIQ